MPDECHTRATPALRSAPLPFGWAGNDGAEASEGRGAPGPARPDRLIVTGKTALIYSRETLRASGGSRDLIGRGGTQLFPLLLPSFSFSRLFVQWLFLSGMTHFFLFVFFHAPVVYRYFSVVIIAIILGLMTITVFFSSPCYQSIFSSSLLAISILYSLIYVYLYLSIFSNLSYFYIFLIELQNI